MAQQQQQPQNSDSNNKSILITNDRKLPPRFWQDKRNHRLFLDWAAQQLGIRHLDDWYGITAEQVNNNLGGSRLIRGYYSNSLLRALSAAYPDHAWLPWRFDRVTLGYWDSLENQRLFFDWALTQLLKEEAAAAAAATTTTTSEIRRASRSDADHGSDIVIEREQQQQQQSLLLDEWYKYDIEDVDRLGGKSIISGYYNSSLHRALAAVYPEHEWLPWRFKQVPRRFWENMANQRRFFDWAGTQLGIYPTTSTTTSTSTSTTASTGDVGVGDDSSSSSSSNNHNNHNDNLSYLSGWYGVSRDDVCALGGHGVLNERYGYSLIRALAAVYPEYPWDPWRFQRCTLGKDELVVDEPTLRRFVEGTLAPQLQVETLDDWYRVSTKSLSHVVGYATMIRRHGGGLFAVLKRLYPQHDWDEHKFSNGREKRTSQRLLMMATQQLLPPGEEIIEEYAHPLLRFQNSYIAMTLDLWVPSLSLALEFQGEQHFNHIYPLGADPDRQQQLDTEKREACARAGITLVEVPYWWRDECSVADLAATIVSALLTTTTRPDSMRAFLEAQYPALVEAAKRGSPIIRPCAVQEDVLPDATD